MKKKVLLSLMALVVMAGFSTLQAKVVDRDEALEVAADFFRTHNIATLSTSEVREVWNSNQLSTVGVATLSATETPTFYVFAPETGKGFVIVSADDCTESILAYSDKDTFVTDNMPCGFLWWCEAMNDQIARYRETGTESPRKAARQSGISPLASDAVELTTASWDQGTPYNNECPYDGSTRSYTGCVSTSFAIAMRYHTHPTTGSGQTETYTTETKKLTVASRDLSSHTYDWSNMPLSYSSYSSTEASAVATLMADIGALLQADYTSDTDGTATSVGTLTPSYFYKNFGYSPTGLFTQAVNYSDDEWISLMEDQIKNVGPVPYGCGSLVHQFILDGYNTSDQFHINWGWGGSQDGYYSLPEIASDGTETQTAFINFFPEDSGEQSLLMLSGSGLSASVTTFQQNAAFSMDGAIVLNYSSADFSGSMRYVLTDSEGNIKDYISSNISIDQLTFGNGYQWDDIPCVIECEINAGDRIRLAYKSNEDTAWKLMEAISPVSTIYEIVMTDSNIGEPVEYEYMLMMYDTGLTTTATEFATNAYFVINATIVDFSKDIDLCYLNIALCDSNGDIKEWICDEWSDSFAQNYGWSYTKTCVIKGDIEANDRIRVFYQVNNNIEGHWKLVEGYGNAPWEIVISEDQIGEPVEIDYSLNMYTPGLSVNTNEFYSGVEFTASAYVANVSGITVTTNVRFALTDEEGNLKEWISNNLEFSLESGRYKSYTNTACTITGEITAGDCIRVYYQGNPDNEDSWKVIDSYYGETCPLEFEITEDMIIVVKVGEKIYVDNEDGTTICYDVLSKTDVEVTWGGESSESGTPEYAGEITIPATVTYSGTTFNVIGIGENAFRGCSPDNNCALTAITIPNSVTYIGERAFQSCPSLTEIIIPESVTSMGGYMFFNCTDLQTVVIGDGVETIWGYTFRYCRGLESLTIGQKVSTISDYAFSTCTSLKSVDLPNSVTSLGNDVFESCSALTTIAFGSGMQSLGSDVFDGSNAITTITVAEDNQYFSAVNNVLFNKDQTRLVLYPSGAEVTVYAIPEGVTTIADHAFKGSTKLTALTFPESLTTLENYSIEGCTGVNQMTLSTNVTTIGEGAFYGCSGLGTLNILNPTPPSFASRVFEGGPNTTVCVPAGTLAEYKRVWGEASDITGLNAYDELDYAVLKITLSDDGVNGYSTYYDDDYDIDLTDTGIKAYWAENVDEGTVTLTNIGNTIPAKTAVVLKGALTDLTEAKATASSVESTYTTNLLHGHSTTGTLEEEDGDYLYYMLTTNTSGTNVGFYYGATGGAAFSSKANKAWLAVPAGQSNSLSIKFKDEDDTTGISSVSANYGEGDGNIYTIQGIRVNDMSRPGVYIVNGKKILVK